MIYQDWEEEFFAMLFHKTKELMSQIKKIKSITMYSFIFKKFYFSMFLELDYLLFQDQDDIEIFLAYSF